MRDVASGNDTADDLKWVKFSGASWTGDNQGFFYSRYAEPKEEALREQTIFRNFIITAWVPRSLRTCWSMNGPIRKDRHSTAGLRTTAATWSSMSVRGTDSKNLVYYRTYR